MQRRTDKYGQVFLPRRMFSIANSHLPYPCRWTYRTMRRSTRGLSTFHRGNRTPSKAASIYSQASSDREVLLNHETMSDRQFTPDYPSSYDDEANFDRLRQSILDHSFWTTSDDGVLLFLKDIFHTELRNLESAYTTEPSSGRRGETPSPSQIMFPNEEMDYGEIDRTMVGIVALRWLHDGNYNAFTRNQMPRDSKLEPESFDHL